MSTCIPEVEGVEEQIARYVARLVDDGSTLQIGLGRVPNRMLAYHEPPRARDPLGRRHRARRRPQPARHLPGRREYGDGDAALYDLVDDNPRFSFHTVDDACDPEVIAARRGWCP